MVYQSYLCILHEYHVTSFTSTQSTDKDIFLCFTILCCHLFMVFHVHLLFCVNTFRFYYGLDIILEYKCLLEETTQNNIIWMGGFKAAIDT